MHEQADDPAIRRIEQNRYATAIRILPGVNRPGCYPCGSGVFEIKSSYFVAVNYGNLSQFQNYFSA
jgi:hypothetical protein